MPLLSSNEVRRQLETLMGWEVAGSQIRKRYAFGGFKEAMVFVNRVAALAEEIDHHPDILVRYDKAPLTSTSHDLDGLTRRDFALAQRIVS